MVVECKPGVMSLNNGLLSSFGLYCLFQFSVMSAAKLCILPLLDANDPLGQWLTCRQTSINQSINQNGAMASWGMGS